VDRHGQKAPEVRIYHFVGAGFRERLGGEGLRPGQLDGDLEFLARAAVKINQIRADLGTVGPVIAEQVEQAMGRLLELLMHSASSHGFAQMDGYILASNQRMLRLAKRLGFVSVESPEGPTVRKVRCELNRRVRLRSET
jgi:hypothetical protein